MSLRNVYIKTLMSVFRKHSHLIPRGKVKVNGIEFDALHAMWENAEQEVRELKEKNQELKQKVTEMNKFVIASTGLDYDELADKFKELWGE